MVGVLLTSHSAVSPHRLLAESSPVQSSFLRGTALPVHGRAHAVRRRDGVIKAASGQTPTLHVGRLWLKQASKTGQRKAITRKKGSCRRLLPPTATVSIETRPLLQRPFSVAPPLQRGSVDKESLDMDVQDAAVPAHAAWLTYQAAIGEEHTSTEYALGISDRLATLAEYKRIREESLSNLQARRMAAFGKTEIIEN